MQKEKINYKKEYYYIKNKKLRINYLKLQKIHFT